MNHVTTQGPFHTSTCPQCPTRYKNHAEYKKHLEEIHNDQKICGFCGKFFPNSETLQTHMTTAHKGVKFTRKGTQKKGKYNPDKKVVCDLCGKPFAGSLYTHKMKVSRVFMLILKFLIFHILEICILVRLIFKRDLYLRKSCNRENAVLKRD